MTLTIQDFNCLHLLEYLLNYKLWWGSGADVFQFTQLVNTNVIRDFQSQDVIEFLYEDGVDDISTDAVQIEQRGVIHRLTGVV